MKPSLESKDNDEAMVSKHAQELCNYILQNDSTKLKVKLIEISNDTTISELKVLRVLRHLCSTNDESPKISLLLIAMNQYNRNPEPFNILMSHPV